MDTPNAYSQAGYPGPATRLVFNMGATTGLFLLAPSLGSGPGHRGNQQRLNFDLVLETERSKLLPANGGLLILNYLLLTLQHLPTSVN